MTRDDRDDWMDAWTPDAPPRGFADRVLARVASEPASPDVLDVPAARRRPGRLFARVMAGAGVLAAAAALALAVQSPAASRGEATADARREVKIGSRALAVMEDGSQVKWEGDDVTQRRGDVFYRVEKGKRFTVHTPAGDVTVLGTCFRVVLPKTGSKTESKTESKNEDAMNKRDMKWLGAGAVASALALVAVYEGRVAISHAKETAMLSAGEKAEITSAGIFVDKGALGDSAKQAAGANGDDPLSTANRNLVEQVSGYRARLEAMETEKKTVEARLAAAQKKLDIEENGGVPKKNEWEFSKEDWAEMAKTGDMKARLPCQSKDGWTPSSETLDKLGLEPQDADALKAASKRTHDRLWAQVGPACAKALGSMELAERLATMCDRIILETGGETDNPTERYKVVAEMRAGLRPLPAPGEAVDPKVTMLLAMTDSSRIFQEELAKTFGPEEAHRLTYHDAMCARQSHWRSGPNEKPRKK